VIVAAVCALAAAAVFRPPSGPRSLRVFDPDRTADLETDMWQAYYRHESVRLFRGLVTLLHEQYRYSWARASLAGFYLARAARTFGDAHDHYERVLPDLAHAYAMARDWTHASFDPSRVAQAELAWWVARRVPGEDGPEHVGALIAEENALLFDVPQPRVLEASTLRARAGKLRDEGGEEADWATVATLLHDSYRQLHSAVN
jgi:hypothetical protein